MTEKQHVIPVWFFVGIMLLVYGILILASGISEYAHPPDTVLANLHAPIWWGALLTVLGVIYSYHFRPKGTRRGGENGAPGGASVSDSKGGRSSQRG